MRRKYTSIVAIIVFGLVGLWLVRDHSNTPETSSASQTRVTETGPAVQSAKGNGIAGASQKSGAAKIAKTPAQLRAEQLLVTVHNFGSWFTEHRRGHMPNTDDGVRLAKARRAALKELITIDPAAAIANAIPAELRSSLPSAIAAELETQIDARGAFEVAIRTGENCSDIQRWAIIDGKRYSAFVYGKRIDAMTKDDLPMHGIAIDKVFAISDEPFRLIVTEEPKTPIDEQSPGITVLSGNKKLTFASAGELAAWSQAQSEAETTPNPSVSSIERTTAAAVTNSWVMGKKTILWIRMEFPDDPGTPYTDPQIEASMETVNQFYLDNSGNRTSFETTIVPVSFTTSESKSYFNSHPDDFYDIRDNALQAARAYDIANGNTGKYNPDLYDRYIVVFRRLSGFTVSGGQGVWAGMGMVGGKGVWLNGTVAAGTTAHELGHNHGLYHSHAWKPTGTSSIQPGEHIEYGEPFDIMGVSTSIPAGHFNTKQKKNVYYLNDSNIQTVTTAGTYRIYRHDHPSASGVQALKVNLGTSFEYWIEHRQLVPKANSAYTDAVRNGVLLHWGKRPSFATGTGTYLLDNTPGSAGGMDDAPLVIGSSFSEPDFGFTVTPLTTGGSSPAEWIDVSISFGASGNNHNPTLTSNPPSGKIAARTDTTFSAVGSDPDGDTVYYRWDFGDGQITPTTSTVTHRWLRGGTYTVSCTALDGKGGIASTSYSVTVDDPLQTWTKTAESITSSNIQSIVYAKNQFVAAGLYNTILTSSDGLTWSRANGVSGHHYYGIQSDGAQYVAVGERLDSSALDYVGVIARSTDGITWTDQTPSGSIPYFCAVAHGNGRWVAVGTKGTIYNSADAVTWTAATSGVTATLLAVRFEGGLFVTVGSAGTILVSTDGITWENRTVSTAYPFSSVARHNNNWYTTCGYETWSSANGRDWTIVNMTLQENAIFYALHSSSQYSALMAGTSSEKLGISDNAADWSIFSVSTSSGSATFQAFAEGNGLIIAAGTSGTLYRAGTPKVMAPAITTDLRHGLSTGKPSALAVSAQNFARVQLLVDGTVVSEQTSSNPTFTWTPQRFGSYAVQIKGITASGESITTTKQVTASLDRWRWVSPKNPGNNLRDIGYALNRWWAVGDLGAVLSSQDGQTWGNVSLPQRCELRGVAGDSQRVTIAALSYEGSSGYYYGALLTSTDGVSFSPISIPGKPFASLYCIAKENGLWVAAGSSGLLVNSSDGLNWNVLTAASSSTIYSLAYGAGRWTAVGYGNAILTSTDGTTWTKVAVSALSTTSTLNSVDYRNGLWIAVGNSGKAISSADGITWTSLSITGSGTSTLYRVRATDERWVVSGATGLLLTSTDGQTWTQISAKSKTDFTGVDQQNGRWIVAGITANILTGTALDQLALTDSAVRVTYNCALALEDRLLVGSSNVDSSTGNTISPINEYSASSGWTAAAFSGGTPSVFYDIANCSGYYLAVGGNGAIYRSTDAHNWTALTSGTVSTLYAIASSGSQSIVVGNSGTILSSSNGTDWTATSSATSYALRSATYGNGLFVAVGTGGTLVTSPDGQTWTARNSGVSGAIQRVIWTAATGFVATADGSMITQSNDGLTWTAQTLSSNSDTYTGLGVTPYGVIITNTYVNTDRAYVSSDGKTWTLASTPSGALQDYTANNSTLWSVGNAGRILSHSLIADYVAPTITRQPQSQQLTTGEKLSLTAIVDGDAPFVFQWMKDGKAISGATASSFEIASVGNTDAGNYSVVIKNATGTITSQTATVSVITESPENKGRLSNLSIRTNAGTGDKMLIVGLTLDGTSDSATQPILIRAVGPTLESFGVSNTLADPSFSLYKASTAIASNNDWGGSASLSAVFTRLSAFAFSSGTSKDAAMLTSQPKGAYTIQVAGAGTSTGIVLAEVYDATETRFASSPRLVNVSARTTVGTGDNILISGFTIGGTSSCKVLIRAVGPKLRDFGISDALNDPKLEVYSGTTRLYENDNWGGTSTLSAAFKSAYAFDLDTTSKDAALLVTLAPGAYTVQISGVGGTTGVALVEIYQVQ